MSSIVVPRVAVLRVAVLRSTHNDNDLARQSKVGGSPRSTYYDTSSAAAVESLSGSSLSCFGAHRPIRAPSHSRRDRDGQAPAPVAALRSMQRSTHNPAPYRASRRKRTPTHTHSLPTARGPSTRLGRPALVTRSSSLPQCKPIEILGGMIRRGSRCAVGVPMLNESSCYSSSPWQLERHRSGTGARIASPPVAGPILVVGDIRR